MVSVIEGFHCIAVSYTQSACNLDFRLSARTAPWNKLCFQFPTSVSSFLKSQRNECCNTQCAMSKAARQVCLSVCLSGWLAGWLAGRLVDMECPLPLPAPPLPSPYHDGCLSAGGGYKGDGVLLVRREFGVSRSQLQTLPNVNVHRCAVCLLDLR